MLLSSVCGLNSIRAVVPTVILIGVSPTVLLLHTGWRLISIALPKKWYFVVEDAIWGVFQKLVVFMFEICTGMEVLFKGDIPKKVENAVMICNHQTAMDWIVTDFIAQRQGMIGHMRFVFKDILKYFPLFGYVWGAHGGIFVRRDGTHNSKNMKTTLQMLMNLEVPIYLVIYPEGTRFCPGKDSVLSKSRAYAVKSDLEPLDQVLTPRVKAFHCAVSSMGTYLDAVYDATILYENKGEENFTKVRPTAPSMWDVLSGNCRRIYIHFKRIPISEVPMMPGSENPTLKWLHMRFKLKDNLIKEYYAMNKDLKTEDLIHDHRKQITNAFQLASPLSTTLLPSLFLTSLTCILLSFPTGRTVYVSTVLGGTILGSIYAYFFF